MVSRIWPARAEGESATERFWHTGHRRLDATDRTRSWRVCWEAPPRTATTASAPPATSSTAASPMAPTRGSPTAHRPSFGKSRSTWSVTH